jgi:Fic family protein
MWKQLTELPNDWTKLASSELQNLAKIWEEQSKKLHDSNVVREFRERLNREWAIETGIIEGLYSLDRGVTQLLIEHGIHASLIPHGSTDKDPVLVTQIISDQKATLEGIFDFVAGRRKLSESYIKELHASLTRSQLTSQAQDESGKRLEVELMRGEYKKQPNNPTRPDGSIFEYCPPIHVQTEMNRLVDLYLEYEKQNVAPEVLAAWLHHRFTLIHPFQDGNGRVARALASIVFIKHRWFPLVINRDARTEYILNLEKADTSNITPLIQQFSKLQKRYFVKALSLAELTLQDVVPRRDVIGSALDRLRDRLEGRREKQRQVFVIAQRLEEIVQRELRSTRDELEIGLRDISADFRVFADSINEETRHWYQEDSIIVAKQLGYFADFRTYKKWYRLSIREERSAQIVFVFHSLGAEFVGILACAGFMKFRSETNEDGATALIPKVLSDDVFHFAYNEDQAEVEARFREWFTTALLLGLEQWRRQI